MVANHLTSQEIARELKIAKSSVDTYCDRARAKLMVPDRFDAALYVHAVMAAEAPAPTPPSFAVRPATWVYWACTVMLFSFAVAALGMFASVALR